MGARAGGVLVRVYDKGLERGACEAGEWIRWEAELLDWRARACWWALMKQCHADRGRVWEGNGFPSTWREVGKYDDLAGLIRSFSVAAVEFREARPELASRAYKFRPVVEWWRRFVEVLGRVRLIGPKRRAPSLAATVKWAKSCVNILRGMAAEASEDVLHVLRELGLLESDPNLEHAAVFEYARHRGGGLREILASG